MSKNTKQAQIEAEATRRAEELSRHKSVRTGFGAVTTLENALLEMAVLSIGIATGQEQLATRILRDAEKEKP